MTTQTLITPTNLDFETGTIGDVPDSWASPTQKGGYTVRLTDEAPKHGRRCVEIAKSRVSDPPESTFGYVKQIIDATRFRGKRLRFSGWAKTQSALGDWLRFSTSKAQAWIRVDRELGTMGFFDNMNERPIRSSGWRHFEIEGDIANDAEHINVGLLLHGKGKAWLDDVRIEILGDGGIGNQPPCELSQRQLENIVALTRLIGYVRFFHPTKTVERTNWDLFTINATRHVENADSPTELARRLNDVFNPVAPKVQIDVANSKVHLQSSLDDQQFDSKIRFWMHLGVNLGHPYSTYSSRQRTAANSRVFNLTPIQADLGGGVFTHVPTAIPKKDSEPYEGSAFRKLQIEDLPHDWEPSSDDRSTRLAAVILTWNVIQHFYPYFDVVDVDWNVELTRALVRSATDKSESDFYETLERLIAPLCDGHGTVIPGSGNVHDQTRLAHKHASPHVVFAWVDDSVVVTAIGEGVDERLRVGDVVTEIDGQSVETLINSLRGRVSAATPGFFKLVALARLIRGPNGSRFKLKTRSRTGEENEISLERKLASNPSQIIREFRPKQGSELSDGVIYVDLTRMRHVREFKRLLPKLASASGIVFDLRGYAGFEFRDVISHLIDEPVTSAQWHRPFVRNADQTDTKYLRSNWKVKPRAPRLTTNVAFLTDGTAISAAETLMGIIEHYKLAEIVGEPTAGTNGDVNPFTVPGGFTIVWTGLRVLKHDGSQHHGVGIHPTIPVSRTIDGIASGRDEFLERAVKVVVQNIESG